MTFVLEKEAKAERIEIRVTPKVKALLMAAAQSKHTTISEFLLNYGIEAAEQEISVPRVFYASEQGWDAIHRLLDEDNEPSEATITWLANRRPRD